MHHLNFLESNEVVTIERNLNVVATQWNPKKLISSKWTAAEYIIDIKELPSSMYTMAKKRCSTDVRCMGLLLTGPWNENLVFIHPGDWVVEFIPGQFTIVPADIFKDWNESSQANTVAL